MNQIWHHGYFMYKQKNVLDFMELQVDMVAISGDDASALSTL